MIDLAPGKNWSFWTNNRGRYCYILVIKDHFYKFCWLFPIKAKSANRVHSILHNFFYYDKGVSKYLQTDNGKDFIAEVINNLCTSLGVTIIHGCPYHQKSQGRMKKFEQTCKKKSQNTLPRNHLTNKPNFNPTYSHKLQEKSTQHGTKPYKMFPSGF